MNFEQSDSFKNELERNARSKKNVVISLVFCAFLVVLLVILIVFLKHQDAITEKLFIDDAQVKIPANLYKVVENERYVNIKVLAELLGYNYTKGIYGEYTEDADSCYIQNNFEIVAITASSDKFTKHLELGNGEHTLGTLEEIGLKREGEYSEAFEMEKPVIFEDETLYVPQQYVSPMFNIQVEWEEYRIRFYTLKYLLDIAQKTMAEKGLVEIDKYYENLKALNYGYIVVGNSTNIEEESTEYGVLNILNGDVIISSKYDDITFVENSKEFYITAANGTVGILDNKGGTVIAPSEFEKISLLDAENKLYLVEKNSEYGVLNKKGEIIIYAEYDEVGIDIEDFVKEEVDNKALFFEKCIPVKKDEKFGLYDIKGTRLLEPVYDGLGYKTPEKTTSSGSEQSCLLIPSYVGINGIVVNYDDKFGIFDVNEGALILPTVFDKIYSIKKEGERTYYVSYNGMELELSQYLKENNLNNVNEKGEVLAETEPVTEVVETDGEVVEEVPVENSTEETVQE